MERCHGVSPPPLPKELGSGQSHPGPEADGGEGVQVNWIIPLSLSFSRVGKSTGPIPGKKSRPGEGT